MKKEEFNAELLTRLYKEYFKNPKVFEKIDEYALREMYNSLLAKIDKKARKLLKTAPPISWVCRHCDAIRWDYIDIENIRDLGYMKKIKLENREEAEQRANFLIDFAREWIDTPVMERQEIEGRDFTTGDYRSYELQKYMTDEEKAAARFISLFTIYRHEIKQDKLEMYLACDGIPIELANEENW